jgi:hypothetical protein
MADTGRLAYAAVYSRAPALRRPAPVVTDAEPTEDSLSESSVSGGSPSDGSGSDDSSTVRRRQRFNSRGSANSAARSDKMTPSVRTGKAVTPPARTTMTSRIAGRKPAPPLASSLRKGGALPVRRPVMTFSAGADGEQVVSVGFDDASQGPDEGPLAAPPSSLPAAHAASARRGMATWLPLGGSGSSVPLLSSSSAVAAAAAPQAAPPPLHPSLQQPSSHRRVTTASTWGAASVPATAASERHHGGGGGHRRDAVAAAVPDGSSAAAAALLPAPTPGLRCGDPSRPSETHLTALPVPPEWLSLLARTEAALAAAATATARGEGEGAAAAREVQQQQQQQQRATPTKPGAVAQQTHGSPLSPLEGAAQALKLTASGHRASAAATASESGSGPGQAQAESTSSRGDHAEPLASAPAVADAAADASRQQRVSSVRLSRAQVLFSGHDPSRRIAGAVLRQRGLLGGFAASLGLGSTLTAMRAVVSQARGGGGGCLSSPPHLSPVTLCVLPLALCRRSADFERAILTLT